MEVSIIITIGLILLVIGLVSCVLPPLPGPPIAYVALIIAHFWLHETEQIPSWMLLTYGLITLIVLVADYFVPIWGTKKFGGTKAGIRGSFIGIVVGILLTPFGGVWIIVCPFLGAMFGEMVTGHSFDVAIRAGIGSFVGFLVTSGIKIILVLMMCYHYFKAVFT